MFLNRVGAEKKKKRGEHERPKEKKSIFIIIITVPAAVFLKGFSPVPSVRWPLGSVAECVQMAVMLLSLLQVAVVFLSMLHMAAMLLRLLC